MVFLFHCTEIKKDGNPFVSDFAEFHQILEHDYFINKVKQGFKTDRDKNCSYIYSTQSVEDAVGSEIGTAIREQTATNFFLPNPNGEFEFYKKLSISPQEFKFINQSTTKSRQVMVKQQSRAVVLDFNLYGIKKYLPVLSANKTLNNLFDETIKKYGEEWLEPFLEKASSL
jgi:type IV secretion system protein VirB4